jgi:hypothetical protein
MSEEFEAPRPKTEEEFLAYIREALTLPAFEVPEGAGIEAYQTQEAADAYGAAADAMWKCALAAFNYAADQVGATGWQASWAEMIFLKHSRGLKGPFALIDGNDLLYPQYDIPRKVERLLVEWGPWAGEEARKRLAECDADRAVEPAPRVRARWEELARLYPAEEAKADD